MPDKYDTTANGPYSREHGSGIRHELDPAYAIVAKGLTKTFGKYTAVQSLDLEVKRGIIYGCLGANGAGKTTTVRMLCGTLTPTEGTAYITGLDISSQTVEAKQQLALVPDRTHLPDKLCVREYLEFIGDVYRISSDEIAKRSRELLELFGLFGKREQPMGSLSLGQRQKCVLAAALLPRPRVLFLDEPTVAVDVTTSAMIQTMLEDLARLGYTIFITTHDFLFAEAVCDEIGIIHDHGLLKQGSLQELRSAAPSRKSDSLKDVFVALTEISDAYEPLSFFEDINAEKEPTDVNVEPVGLHNSAVENSDEPPESEERSSQTYQFGDGHNEQAPDSEADNLSQAATNPSGELSHSLPQPADDGSVQADHRASGLRRWIPAPNRSAVFSLFRKLYLRSWWRDVMLEGRPARDQDAVRALGGGVRRAEDSSRTKRIGHALRLPGRRGTPAIEADAQADPAASDAEDTVLVSAGSGTGIWGAYLWVVSVLVMVSSLAVGSYFWFSAMSSGGSSAADGFGQDALAAVSNLMVIALFVWSLPSVIKAMFLSQNLGSLEGLPLTEGQMFRYALGSAAFKAGALTGLGVLAVFVGYGVFTIGQRTNATAWQIVGTVCAQLLYYVSALVASVGLVVFVVALVAVIGMVIVAVVPMDRVMLALVLLLIGMASLGSYLYPTSYPGMFSENRLSRIGAGMEQRSQSLPDPLGQARAGLYAAGEFLEPVIASTRWQAPPGGFVAKMLAGAGSGPPLMMVSGLLSFGVLVGLTLIVSRLVAIKLYEQGRRKVRMSTRPPRTRFVFSGLRQVTRWIHTRTPWLLSAPVAAAFTKEVSSYVRDYSRAFSLALWATGFAGGISLLAFSLPALAESVNFDGDLRAALITYASQAYGLRPSADARNALFILLIPYVFAALIAWGVAASVGNSCVGLEGRGYAIWAASPASTAQLLWGKWLAILVFSGFTGLVLEGVVYFFSGLAYWPGLVFGVLASLFAAACSGWITVGMSARYARLDHDDPDRATTRRAGLAGVGPFAVILLAIFLLRIVGTLLYIAGVPWTITVAGSVILWAMLVVATGLWVFRWGARGLQEAAW